MGVCIPLGSVQFTAMTAAETTVRYGVCFCSVCVFVHVAECALVRLYIVRTRLCFRPLECGRFREVRTFLNAHRGSRLGFRVRVRIRFRFGSGFVCVCVCVCVTVFRISFFLI